MRKYFGTDGIRFIYTKEIDNTLKKLANSLSILKAKQIIIGRDTRESSLNILNVLKEHLYTAKRSASSQFASHLSWNLVS